MNYACDLCKKIYTDKSNLQPHKRVAHFGKRFACQKREKIFTRPGKLKNHKCVASMRAKDAQEIEPPHKRVCMEEENDDKD